MRKLKTFEISTIILLTLAIWSAGCARLPASQDKPRIALIMKSLANEFFQTMENGAKAHQRENAGEYDLIANGTKDEQDVSRQIDLVEQMIAQRVAAIVIAPADSKALVAVCKRALDAGIPVINIDNKFDASVLADKGVNIPFVGPDNRKGARLAGEYLAKRLKPGDKVAIIEGVPNAFNGVQRRLGFEDAMKSSRIEIASSQSGYWETSPANQVASSIITEQPDLKAILCANDNMALGAVAALRAAGRSKDVLVIGFDNISAVQQLIKDGQILATVDQHADLLAVYGIEYALKIIKSSGSDAPDDRETPVDLITAESLK
jgi:ribose transport system substrate-binding protein